MLFLSHGAAQELPCPDARGESPRRALNRRGPFHSAGTFFYWNHSHVQSQKGFSVSLRPNTCRASADHCVGPFKGDITIAGSTDLLPTTTTFDCLRFASLSTATRLVYYRSTPTAKLLALVAVFFSPASLAWRLFWGSFRAFRSFIPPFAPVCSECADCAASLNC